MKSFLNYRNLFTVLIFITVAVTLVSLLLGGTSCKKKSSEQAGNSPAQPVSRWAGELAGGSFVGRSFILVVPPPMYSDTAGKLLTVYSMATINPEQVPAFVRENRVAFQNVQQLYNCSGRFEEMVAQAILFCPTRDEIYADAMNVAGSDPELGRLAGQVSDASMQTLGDLSRLAQYFRELSISINGILQGRDEPYYQSEVYTIGKLAEPALQFLGPKAKTYFFNATYVWMRPIVEQACR